MSSSIEAIEKGNMFYKIFQASVWLKFSVQTFRELKLMNVYKHETKEML